MHISIYRNAAIIYSVRLDTSSELMKKLLEGERAKVNFTVESPIGIQIGDYVTIYGINYYLNLMPVIRKQRHTGFTMNVFLKAYTLISVRFRSC